jgi:hypothetical protein
MPLSASLGARPSLPAHGRRDTRNAAGPPPPPPAAALVGFAPRTRSGSTGPGWTRLVTELGLGSCAQALPASPKPSLARRSAGRSGGPCACDARPSGWMGGPGRAGPGRAGWSVGRPEQQGHQRLRSSFIASPWNCRYTYIHTYIYIYMAVEESSLNDIHIIRLKSIYEYISQDGKIEECRTLRERSFNQS